MSSWVKIAALGAALSAVACGSNPSVKYYQLALPDGDPRAHGQGILAVEELVADAAFEDQRMVYRQSPYSLNYYYYHRWSAPPGIMVSDFLRLAYKQSGRFRDVMSGYTPGATTVLSGRVMALEEVDVNKKKWLARVRIALHLRDADSGQLLWSTTVSEEEPVESRTPEGVAQALTAAMRRIVDRTVPEIARRTSTRAQLSH